jgi:uncharacterized membrane protein
MKTDRLMAFTDGVLAIVITIMVIDLHVSPTDSWERSSPRSRCLRPMRLHTST